MVSAPFSGVRRVQEISFDPRFFVWLVIGFAIYFPFGRKHSALATK